MSLRIDIGSVLGLLGVLGVLVGGVWVAGNVLAKPPWLTITKDASGNDILFLGGKCYNSAGQVVSCPSSIQCPTGQNMVNGACVPITCPAGTSMQNGVCTAIQCPTGQTLVGNTCQPIQCPTGYHLANGLCVQDTAPTTTCPAGQHLQNGVCVPDSIPVTGGLVDNFDSGTYVLGIGQTSPNGAWKTLYVGGGVNQQMKLPDGNGVFQMQPKTATGTIDSSGVGYETYAPQVLSVKTFGNFQLDFDMRTVKQLRQNLPANAWEVGWIMWRFTDESPKSNHHYYFILKPTGSEFGKKDNAPGDTGLEQQIYLPRVSNKNLVLNTWNHYTIIAQGNHHIVKVDGQTIVDYNDTPNDPAKMAVGKIGFYNEDAQVQYDNFNLVPLP